MLPPPEQQRIVDREHLRLLTIFHWVQGGLTAFFSLFPIIHLVMGLAMLSGKFPMAPAPAAKGQPPPEEMVRLLGGMFVVVALIFICTGLTFAVLTFFSARFLGRQRHRIFSLVVAGLNCLLVPFGTVLGVFTLVVLSRPSVAALYEGEPRSGA
jgi:hypothetical protein